MTNMDLSTIVELAKLKKDKPKEYAKICSSIKEVLVDMQRLTVEIGKELEEENNKNKKKEREELDLRIAEKMRRDKPGKWNINKKLLIIWINGRLISNKG